MNDVGRILAEALVGGARITRQGAASRYMDGRLRFGGKRIFRRQKQLPMMSEFGGYLRPKERRWRGQKA